MKNLLILMLVLGLATTANAYIVSNIELDLSGGMSAIAIKLPSGMSYANEPIGGGYWALIASSNASSPVETTTGGASGGTLAAPATMDMSALYGDAVNTGWFSSGSGIWGEFTTSTTSTTWTAAAGNYLTGVSATSAGVSLYLIDDNFGYVTHVETLPEPATVMLLGLGGLFLRRRRK